MVNKRVQGNLILLCIHHLLAGTDLRAPAAFIISRILLLGVGLGSCTTALCLRIFLENTRRYFLFYSKKKCLPKFVSWPPYKPHLSKATVHVCLTSIIDQRPAQPQTVGSGVFLVRNESARAMYYHIRPPNRSFRSFLLATARAILRRAPPTTTYSSIPPQSISSRRFASIQSVTFNMRRSGPLSLPKRTKSRS